MSMHDNTSGLCLLSEAYLLMRRRMPRLVVIATIFWLSISCVDCKAQIINSTKSITDSLRQEFNNGPYFTLYRDNYFAVGTDPVHKPTADNSDVKFQISIAQRLTKATLPGNTFLFLTFTQVVAWDVFKNSMPMHDFTFNPGIGISRPLFSKDRYIGKATILLEHMSNGRDSIQSRSWNRIAFGATIMVDDILTVNGKFWIPIVDGENNRDILKYTGISQAGISVTTRDKKFGGTIQLTKRKNWKLDFNTEIQLFWRPWKQANQYFFLEWYNGYGENLIDYNKFHNRLRVGLLIRPKFFSEF